MLCQCNILMSMSAIGWKLHLTPAPMKQMHPLSFFLGLQEFPWIWQAPWPRRARTSASAISKRELDPSSPCRAANCVQIQESCHVLEALSALTLHCDTRSAKNSLRHFQVALMLEDNAGTCCILCHPPHGRDRGWLHIVR